MFPQNDRKWIARSVARESHVVTDLGNQFNATVKYDWRSTTISYNNSKESINQSINQPNTNKAGTVKVLLLEM